MKKIDKKIESLESYVLLLRKELSKKYSMDMDKK
jgi:hypothetical protein